ncbi:MAG TPA: biosynthetic-type acetolactate synthase large subunit [Eubacteriaceae bacterium]|nr:biosynthetic-type acetolactate synthase large subunit [Eubacteriaceae bacterium]
MTGSQMVLECLKEQEVDTIFGYQGGAVIPLFDALYDQTEHFNIVRPAHEQHAVHAADAYARTTKKPGVCIVTSGPGATNTVTGIANAYMDSVPVVVMTGQVASALLGKDSFQEIDITGITMPITKYNVLVKEIKDLPQAITRAFEAATSGRPGPVLIDITKDVLMGKDHFVSCKNTGKALAEAKSYQKEVEEVASLINESRRPIIYAGGGIKLSNAQQAMVRLAEKNSIPVVNTLMGLGTIDRESPLSIGLVGMHGFRETNLAVTNSDLILAIGARFSDRVTGNKEKFAPDAKIVHIDIDDAEIDKNMQTHYSCVSDVKPFLEALCDRVAENDRKEWVKSINDWKYEKPCNPDTFNAKVIIETLSDHYKNEENVVVTDVGQHQMWAAQYWKFNGKTDFVTSGGLGTMGFGIGASYGSKVGNPNKNVILFVGDGGFRMSCQELVTIARYKIPVLIVLMNNSTLGMVRQWQKLFSNKRYMETDIEDSIDFEMLTKAYGIESRRFDKVDEFQSFVQNLQPLSQPLFVECKVDKDDCVLPIVPPGEAINELIVDH